MKFEKLNESFSQYGITEDTDNIKYSSDDIFALCDEDEELINRIQKCSDKYMESVNYSESSEAENRAGEGWCDYDGSFEELLKLCQEVFIEYLREHFGIDLNKYDEAYKEEILGDVAFDIIDRETGMGDEDDFVEHLSDRYRYGDDDGSWDDDDE